VALIVEPWAAIPLYRKLVEDELATTRRRIEPDSESGRYREYRMDAALTALSQAGRDDLVRLLRRYRKARLVGTRDEVMNRKLRLAAAALRRAHGVEVQLRSGGADRDRVSVELTAAQVRALLRAIDGVTPMQAGWTEEERFALGRAEWMLKRKLHRSPNRRKS
jgi:hypothetical protein